MVTTEERKKVLSDAEARNQASSVLDKNIIVMAGAGTGKTTLLVDRLLFLILGQEIPVERIVALTFTKKAAEEMRERLESRLRDVIEDPDSLPLLWATFPEAKTRCQTNAEKALGDIPKSQLGTIHSFAGYLLRLFPLQANVDPKFREDEGDLFDEIFEQEWRLWVAQELRSKAPREKLWEKLLVQVPIDDFKELARQLSTPAIDLNHLDTPVQLSPLIDESKKQLSTLLQQNGFPEKAKVFSRGLEALQNTFELLSKNESVPEDHMEALQKMAVDKPPKAWISSKEGLKKLRNQAIGISNVNEKLLKDVLEVLYPFIGQFRRTLTSRGVVTFDGLLVLARNLLRDYPDVRKECKRRFDTFLVDEFQDTDPLQGEILFYLAEKMEGQARNWDKVQLESGRLFVVGDPKQSIYRFRGADIAAFESFQEHMLKQGAVEATLSNNFRSEKPLLDFVNTIFPPLMKPEAYVQPPYAPLETIKEEEREAAIEMVQMGSSAQKKTSASSSRKQEAQFIAEWIHDHVGKKINGKMVNYQDCSLLFRSANAFEEYIEAFRKFNIPYLAEGEKFFYQTSEVTEFLNLVSVVSDPDDNLALVGVLRSPIGGLSDLEIFKLKKKEGLDIRKSPPLFKEKIQDLYLFLNDLSKKAELWPAGQVIQEIFDQTWVVELMSQSRFGEQAVANLQKIRSLAEKWSQDNPLSLKSFVKRFKRYREDEKEEGENPLADVKYDAVKLMTIHKAKGLEFPIVFLPNLAASKGNLRDKSVVSRDWKSGGVGLRLPKSGVTNGFMVLLEEENQQKEKAEEIRVFYVASTRAKKKAFLFTREKPSPTAPFTNFLVKGGAFSDAALGRDLRKVPWNEQTDTRSGFHKKKTLGPDWSPVSLAKRIKKRKQEKEKIELLKKFESPSSQMKKEKELEKYNFVDEDQRVRRSSAIKIGLLCHKYLEHWEFNSVKPSRQEIRRKLDRYARLFELIPKEGSSEKILKEAEGILNAFFGSAFYLRLKKAKIVGREIPFLFPLQNKPVSKYELLGMRGVIDLIFEEKGRLIIGDYKTNKIGSKSEKSVAEPYKTQGEIYKKALKKATGREAQFELIFLREGKTIQI